MGYTSWLTICMLGPDINIGTPPNIQKNKGQECLDEWNSFKAAGL